MNSHELAKLLMELPDCPVTIVNPAGGPYNEEFPVHGKPWCDYFGHVRIQVGQSLSEIPEPTYG